MARWFFLSYAREDADPYFQKFREELVEAVRVKVGGAREDVAFFDRESIGAGESFGHTIGNALATSRIFVPVYSPTYFASASCGREWTAFAQRIERGGAATPPPVILPVLWVGEDDLSGRIPAVARSIQWDQAAYGEEYIELGARQLMMLGRHRDRRRILVEALADRIVDVAQAHELPELPLPFDFSTLTSAFHVSAAEDPTNGESGEGPRYVQFLFVAGKRDELMPLRQHVSAYGEQGEEWRPYHPDVEMAVRDVALEVALTERLWPEAVPLGPDLIARLTAAERSNKLVAIIVDTWTLRLEQYHEFMREYDRHNFLNCVVLIPWNEADPETMGARTMLQQAMQAAFMRRVQVRDTHTFIDTIGTAPDLRNGLARALAVARARVIYAAEVRRRVEQDQVIMRPVIGVRMAGG